MVVGQPALIILSTSIHAPAMTPAALAFAEAIGSNATILLRVPQRTRDEQLPHYCAILRENLPSELQQLPIEPVRANLLMSRLQDIAKQQGGLIAIQPTRRRSLRMILRNDFERLMIEGPLPVLTIPREAHLTRIKNVLFPADFSPRSSFAFDAAIALCQQFDAQLHLLHVFGSDRLLPDEIDQERRNAAQTPRELFALDKETLANMAEHARQKKVRTVPMIAEGRAHTKIVSYANENAIDLIVLASHGPRSSEDILSGTSSARVVLASDVPVLTFPG